ncbi:hypothetical protein [Spiroplasma taiwanense]|uniref:Uncharacterized protein n=1 Tax=Spiroplasma taiwanense CT-1 TaxID=1276220 RepID=S5LU91_9MOLU|nr:hypothetical protein [Spiroplasma taiwanense]AGR41329.1 hypothetical protein STAIW_v1c07150 [Spiroplasma taiwanense CT-1]
MEQFHLEDLNSQTYVSPIIVIDLIVKMWDLMSVISFFSYNTYEAKIDNTQSLLYSEMGIKLPLLNIPLSPVGANATSVLLTESPLETMPEIEGIESKQLFVFRNKYFHTKEDAINEMKIDMYLHPENYANTTKMMTNSFNKEHIFTYEIPKICTVNNDENENIDCIT